MADERSAFRRSAIIGYELEFRPVRLLGLRGHRLRQIGSTFGRNVLLRLGRYPVRIRGRACFETRSGFTGSLLIEVSMT